MLEPDELPEDLHVLERDLSKLSREEISDELQSRVMTEVRVTMRREASRRTIRQRTLLVVGSLATVAALVLIVLRQTNDIPVQRQSSPRQVTISGNEEIKSVPLPTFLNYRLSHHDSPDEWETLIERRADAFIISHEKQAPVIAWTDQMSILKFGD